MNSVIQWKMQNNKTPYVLESEFNDLFYYLTMSIRAWNWTTDIAHTRQRLITSTNSTCDFKPSQP